MWEKVETEHELKAAVTGFNTFSTEVFSPGYFPFRQLPVSACVPKRPGRLGFSEAGLGLSKFSGM